MSKNINYKGILAIFLYMSIVGLSGYIAWLSRDVSPDDEAYLNPSRLEYKADIGDAQAQYLLGMLYFSGHNVKEDQPTAIKWLKRSAGNNNVSAQYQLCNLLEQADPITAFKMCYIAAQKMHREASAKLGVWYIKGTPNEPPNGIKGATYLSIAAEQGHPTAMYNLAQLYKSGAGIKENMELAYFWVGVSEILEQDPNVKTTLTETKAEWGSKLNKKTRDELDKKITEKLNSFKS